MDECTRVRARTGVDSLSARASTSVFYTLSLHDALPIFAGYLRHGKPAMESWTAYAGPGADADAVAAYLGQQLPAPQSWQRSEEHTSELQSRGQLVCRLLLEKKNPGLGIPRTAPGAR